jgi:hypothetical protein
MTFEQALDHSYERLLLMLEAKKRSRASLILDLAQAIVAGWGDKDAWAEKQKKLIDNLNTGL